MKCNVNSDKCIGCGNCVALTDSKIFDFNDDGLAKCIVSEITNENEEIVKEAKEECPTEAIEIK